MTRTQSIVAGGLFLASTLAIAVQDSQDARRAEAAEEGGHTWVKRVLAGCEHGKVHVRLRFDEPPELEDHKRLAPGLRVLSPLCGGAYVVSIRCQQEGRESLRILQAMDSFDLRNNRKPLFDINDKLSKALRAVVAASSIPAGSGQYCDLPDGGIPDWARSRKGRVKTLIQFHADVKPGVARRVLNGTGAEPYGPTSWSALLDTAQFERVARADAVKRLELGPAPPVFLVDRSRAATGTDLVHGIHVNNSNAIFSNGAAAARIGICDGGIYRDHPDFKRRQFFGGRGIRKGGNHGTWVASIAAGSGAACEFCKCCSQPFQFRGHAPEAALVDLPAFGASREHWWTALQNYKVDVTNHSYIESSEPCYGTVPAELDRIVRGELQNGERVPARPQVWAAGNCGEECKRGCISSGDGSVVTLAKNTISVGAVNASGIEVWTHSSRGPLPDSRLKPDLVAPGCLRPGAGLRAAQQYSKGYNKSTCGTSMAAPTVSGIIGLMVAAHRKTYGVNRKPLPSTLLPSTYKAILINTAKDLIAEGPVPYGEGPDFATGYGLVQAPAAVEGIAPKRWVQDSIARTERADRFCIDVPKESEVLSVTLAWDDEPGDTTDESATCPKLVNDLDLELHHRDREQPFLPALPAALEENTQVGPAAPGHDRLNTVEQIRLAKPMEGVWRVEVSGFSLPTGNAQPYSIASSHPFVDCPPSARPDSTALCRELPEACDPGTERAALQAKGRWHAEREDEVVVLDLAHACDTVLDCPGCDGRPWEICDPWTVRLSKLPPDSKVTVYDDEGTILAVDDSGTKVRRIEIRDRRHGQRLYAAIAFGEDGRLRKPVRLKIADAPAARSPRGARRQRQTR